MRYYVYYKVRIGATGDVISGLFNFGTKDKMERSVQQLKDGYELIDLVVVYGKRVEAITDEEIERMM